MPCRVSSGAHERVNEVPTVLARGPVNPLSRCTVRHPPAGREDPVELYRSPALAPGRGCVA